MIARLAASRWQGPLTNPFQLRLVQRAAPKSTQAELLELNEALLKTCEAERFYADLALFDPQLNLKVLRELLAAPPAA
jgi:hypothetical protein